MADRPDPGESRDRGRAKASMTTRVRARLGMAPEDLAWLGVIAGAPLLAVAIAWLAPALEGLYPSPAQALFPEWAVLVKPEPREEVRAMFALAAAFVIALLVGLLGEERSQRRSLDPLVLSAQLVLVVLLGFAVLEQPRESGFLPENYFSPLLLSVPVIAGGAVLGVLLTIAAIGWRGRTFGARSAGYRQARQWWAAGALAALATAIFLLPAVVTEGTLSEAGPLATGHVSVQGEDYFAVVNGRTALVDYIAQYANLLPLAVEPILEAFDTSVASYSITVCLLSWLAMLAVFGVFGEVTRRPWAALGLFVPWVALSLIPWDDVGPFREFNGNYYGVLPGRYLGPFLLAWLTARSLRKPIPPWALFGFAGLVALNNWEFGLAALLALVVAQLAVFDWWQSPWRRRRSLALQAGAGLLGAVVVVCAITLLRAGELPSFELLNYFSRVFLRDAFGLVPMPFLGLHWAMYATYLGALLVTAVRIVRRAPDRTTTAMLAFAGTFGLLTAMYFVGRSSQFQLILLFPAWGLALALLVPSAVASLREAREDRVRLRRILIPACAALIGFGVMTAAIARVSPPWRQIDRLSETGPDPGLEATTEFVEARTEPGERVLIIASAPGHLVAERAGVVDASPINGPTALLSEAEADRSLNQLEEEGGAQVFEAVPDLVGFTDMLRARGYRIAGSAPEQNLRLWRRTEPG
jgi:hypothetical protein